MTLEQELDLYKKALVDWEKPIEECEENETLNGFCWYFTYIHNILIINGAEFNDKMPTLYSQGDPDNGKLYDYETRGDEIEGRQQRVTALKNAIEILENKLKQEV